MLIVTAKIVLFCDLFVLCDIMQLGIQSTATNGLIVKELSDELVTRRVSYVFSDKVSGSLCFNGNLLNCYQVI